jgi:hypothetical protein
MRRGAVEVGWQSQDGKRRGELAPPGVDLAGERIAREVQPLPERMVAVLQGGLGERRRPSRGEGSRRAPRPLARERGSIRRRRLLGER